MKRTHRVFHLLAFCIVAWLMLLQAVRAEDAAWQPNLYGFCMDMPSKKPPSIAEQAKLLDELGYPGVGYRLWLGEELDANLRTLDKAGLDVCLLYTTVNLDPAKRPYDPRVEKSIRKLRGRDVTISVLLTGFPPGDPQGMEPAVRSLRKLGDAAEKSGLRISIYHHVNNWTESFPFTLEVIEKVDHEAVGANFNLCHWLKIEGDRDYRPLLEAHGQKIFAVTINGAQLGTGAWPNGLIQPLDRGDFDNRRLLSTLRQVGYRGPVGLMCYAIPDNTREHLERSMKTWRSWQLD